MDKFQGIFEGDQLSVCPTDEDRDDEREVVHLFQCCLNVIRSLKLDALVAHKNFEWCFIYLMVNLKQERWNTKELVIQATALLEQILVHHDSGLKDKPTLISLSAHLCGENHKKIRSFIDGHFCLALTRNGWQDKALSLALFQVYCLNLKFPVVSDHLDTLLPPSLNLVDSHIDSLKVLGVNCLYHIMNECGKTELRWHGRSKVIYDGLQKLTYSKDHLLLTILHPALIKVVQVIQAGNEDGDELDTLYSRLLRDMYLEDKILLRRVYVESASRYITALGEKVTRHLKLTMKVLLSYLESGCGEGELTRIPALRALCSVTELSRDRVKFYYVPMVKALLILLLDVSLTKVDTGSREEIKALVCSILKPMRSDYPDIIDQSMTIVLDQLNANDGVARDTLQQVKSQLQYDNI